MPAPHHSVFTGRMPFLPPNQQRQSTEGIDTIANSISPFYFIFNEVDWLLDLLLLQVSFTVVC